ncbi:sporulation protein YunB [Pradoshia eiseniae]|uniref:Sporulation protein YunB n=1 Tax=Pradoshia eiseniae TaxID=2064768 RepID=A0A2S7MZN3_9BACI|nr:sporulation protein YunB [Pradoshia eiseniae]PQD95195.1 sporulation protein YunB [Pradoshia eiseniae]
MFKKRAFKRQTLFPSGPLPMKHVLLISFGFFIVSTILAIWIVNKAIEPTLMKYAESETKKMASVVINKAIEESIAENKDLNEVISEIPKEGEQISVEGIRFNTEIINRFRADTTTRIQEALSEIEAGNLSAVDYLSTGSKKEGIIHEVPLGKVTNNALLGNMGPDIPVEIHSVSDVQSDVKTTLEPYGINNALIKVVLFVEVNAQVVVPFSSKPTKITTDVPIAMRTTSGQVPSYYNGNGGGGAGPAIQLPTK